MWVLKNTDTGRYVAPPGRSHSYTQSLMSARKFKDRDAAMCEACGNETAIDLEELINGPE